MSWFLNKGVQGLVCLCWCNFHRPVNHKDTPVNQRDNGSPEMLVQMDENGNFIDFDDDFDDDFDGNSECDTQLTPRPKSAYSTDWQSRRATPAPSRLRFESTFDVLADEEAEERLAEAVTPKSSQQKLKLQTTRSHSIDLHAVTQKMGELWCVVL